MSQSYIARMQRRASIVRTLRQFFDAQGFIEVDTPVAQTSLAPEPHLEAPAVVIRSTKPEQRFLQTSPELLMKRVLALGLPRIYQIAPAFRDGDMTDLHRPEFRIVEWYRTSAPWTHLMDDCEELIVAIARALGHAESVPYQGRAISLTRPFPRVSVDEAFVRHAGFSILDALTPETLRPHLVRLGIHSQSDDSWDDLFHRVFLSRVEPALLQHNAPLFLTHYPKPLAALARLSDADPRVSERFELYLGGMELANAFGELVDPDEQRERFAQDRALRVAKGMHDYPVDERFFTALASLPPSSGIALGLDRLLMFFCDARAIDEVAFVPWSET